MRASQKNALAFVMALATALPAIGQNGPGCAQCAQVHREPYTAEFKMTHVQTLPDGTTITRETKELTALDSQGRRMNANSIQMGGISGQSEMLQTRVHDPVENTEASWNTQNKTARVTKLPPEDQRHGCWANDAGNYRANYGPIRLPDQPGSGSGVMGAMLGSSTVVSSGPVAPGSTVVSAPLPATMPRTMPNRPETEDLGSDVIQGVEVHGYRTTRTIPVGQIGNDRPIVSTDETWMAPSLGIALRSVNDSPQVVSLTIGDPDPSVFQPPEGYKVTVDVLHEVPCQQNQP
jgi:hypothetical protein